MAQTGALSKAVCASSLNG